MSRNNNKSSRSPAVKEHFCWIDLFSKNQHVVQAEEIATELAGNVSAAEGVLLVLHPLDRPVMLARVWCLLEVCQALTLEASITGISSIASMMSLDEVILRERSTHAARFHNKGKLPSQTLKTSKRSSKKGKKIKKTGDGENGDDGEGDGDGEKQEDGHAGF
jgi:hypothetical protein